MIQLTRRSKKTITYSPICIYLRLPNAMLKTGAWTYWYSRQRHRRDGGGEVRHRHMANDLIGAGLCGWTSRGCDLIGADDLIGTGLWLDLQWLRSDRRR
jgi:hypothetical protein